MFSVMMTAVLIKPSAVRPDDVCTEKPEGYERYAGENAERYRRPHEAGGYTKHQQRDRTIYPN
jgi:hypothetical protein